ncbi:ATP-binding cassette domain-containing protein [Amycolatopsis sp. H20-H5]|uniref:ATP-binding cassette domain-containing protein n=1 Tax=Amycolatopsis sp. H20-H5 TaxID=3046309 RepID=UPI002DBA3122|nr:ATP-binding cassette domain-containing protein [Amycolatopsis sp. H20-H5]MEC3979334.1 ATP-binding cassette domain-containing protein [Amycolatopsis sp. H20-H5]
MTALVPSRASSPQPMIEAIDVCKSFGSVCALDSVTLSAPRGSVLALLGHNGAGKTTLVNILTAMTPLTSGTARVAGFDVAREPRRMREVIGLTGQYASVDERLSGRDNLVLIARLLGADRKAARLRAQTLLEVFDLTGAAKRLAKTYSGGMRRRLDLAVCLVGSPDVIFLDEPTTGLDPSSRINLWEIVETLVEEGTTVLLTTQYLDEADRLADTIAVLSGGSVVASGTAAQLKAQVGERSITVTLEPGNDPRAACAALQRAGMAPTIGVDGLSITTPVRASKELAAVIRALDDEGLEAAELAFGEPTLDDVYLALAKKSAHQPA